MKIIIHQLICGEVNKGWGLIASTFTDINIAKSIAFKADLPEQTSGVQWNPAVRGFSQGEFYLIMKTFEDTSKDVRSGRKFSHVFVISQKEITSLTSISSIIKILPENIDKEMTLKPIELEIINKNVKSVPKLFQGRFNKVISGYVKIKNYNNSIIWIGQENFEIAVSEFWKVLSINERKTFNFGIAFNGSNIESKGINLIAVPESIQSRFSASNFFVVKKNETYQPTDLVERYLIGDSSVQKNVSNFQKIIEAKPFSREDISLIASGINTFEEFGKIKDLKKLNTLSHIIAKYSPSEKQGVDFKKKLVNSILQIAKTSDFTIIKILKNFKIESFENSKQLLSNSLVDWIETYIFTDKNKLGDFLNIFEEIKSNNQCWWEKTIVKQLTIFLQSIQPVKIPIIYNWIGLQPSILNTIQPYIDKSKNSEDLFIEKLPKKISDNLIEEFKIFSIKNRWFKLYAHILKFELKFEDALKELIKVDQDNNHSDAINILLKGTDDKLILNYAANFGDSRIIKNAGLICFNSPEKLSQIDLLSKNGQLIWLEAINSGNKLQDGLKDPTQEIYKLLDYFVGGNSVNDNLLDKISQSEFGDLLTYSGRTDLWPKLPTVIIDNFLVRTSSSLLEKLAKNPTTNIPNDTVLSNYVTQKGIFDFLYYNNNNIKSVIPVFEKFSSLNDEHLENYLKNFNGHISALDATQLGTLILKKKFINSAYVIFHKSTKHNNWKHALQKCNYLLDFVTKAILSISGTINNVNIPTDEWWGSMQEVITYLYSNGNALKTIWKKAGGNEADLLMDASPADVWNDVLNKLRKNKFKTITTNDLLKEINKDYGKNEKFKIIFNLRKNYIKT